MSSSDGSLGDRAQELCVRQMEDLHTDLLNGLEERLSRLEKLCKKHFPDEELNPSQE